MPADRIVEKRLGETRKSSKPIMEKRRRARINDSLNQLKALILDALKKDSSRHSKLEKADILEMTVKHLRGLQRQQLTAAANTSPSLPGQYRAGFTECLVEVNRFLGASDSVDTQVRQRLLNHLAGTCSPARPGTYPAAQPAVFPHAQPVQVQVPVAPTGGQHVQLSPVQAPCPQTTMYGGIPVVPRQVSGGEPVAVLLPSQAFLGGQVPSHVIPVYAPNTPQNYGLVAVHSPNGVTVKSEPTSNSVNGLTTTVSPQKIAQYETAHSPATMPARAALPIESEKMWRPW
ncbi:HES1 [Branchiostoma lanceolatum]|uniref:HES1 protein n=1 Tax=Branchiostoma lanceolatum TaxID=7740 RepID=A0A8J9VIC9_BRALA|nr:HES1 [Branchiostoma lanceolatum]